MIQISSYIMCHVLHMLGYLRRRHSLKSLRNLLLPSKPRLSVDLSSRLQSRANATIVQQHSAQHNLVVAEGFLLVVDVRGAVLAVVLLRHLLYYVYSRELNGSADLRNERPCPSHPCTCTCPDPCPS